MASTCCPVSHQTPAAESLAFWPVPLPSVIVAVVGIAKPAESGKRLPPEGPLSWLYRWQSASPRCLDKPLLEARLRSRTSFALGCLEIAMFKQEERQELDELS